MALFGSSKRAAMMRGAMQPAPILPGVMTGFGSGTFNADGSQATPLGQAGVGTLQATPATITQTGTQGDQARAAEAARSAPAGGQFQPLGGSMRQPFDYDAALQRLAGGQPKQNPWAMALAAIGDGFTNWAGGQGNALSGLLAQRQGYQDRLAEAARTLTDWQYRDYARQNEADLKAAAPFTIGRDRVQFDPATGQSQVLFDGPEDFELYASRLGLEPGTDPYFRAVEDYVLRSSGPSAHTRDKELDDYRTGNDVRMENLRFGNRQRMEGLRQGNRLETIRSRPAPLGRGGGRDAAGQGGDGLPVVSSPAEASRLPKGTRFRTPDGRVKVVP